ncbi:MAG: aminopeptidase, partial [Candidatus Aenigmarchaeota archaeon]|nr:aminopeptidase [Candidatus Aenigmarchaeota archaeon]
KGGNVPVGEVYTPCRGKFVEGKVVIDLSSRIMEGTQIVKDPITLNIEKGTVTSIDGGAEAKNLEKTLKWAHENSEFPWGVRRIGELGIGMNPKAQIIGSMNIDEKVIGTAHVAIGSNYWFGGTIYAIIHLDQVFSNPKIEVDGQLLDIPQANSFN